MLHHFSVQLGKPLLVATMDYEVNDLDPFVPFLQEDGPAGSAFSLASDLAFGAHQ